MGGKSYDNRLIASALKLGSNTTPDVCTDQRRDIKDLPYTGQGLSKIEDNTLVVIGDTAVDAFDIRTGHPRSINNVSNSGTDTPRSVFEIAEGGLGQDSMVGVGFKDAQGHIRIFNSYSAPVISDRIRDDFDGSNQGIVSLNSTDAEFIHAPQQRLLILAYNAILWVFDFKQRGWYDWRFVDQVNHISIGVDGEVFLTDGSEIFVYPQAGAVDTVTPIWVSGFSRLDPKTRAKIKRVDVDYICAGTTLQPGIYVDNVALTDSTSVMPASATETTDNSSYRDKTTRRKFAVEIHVTTPANVSALTIENVTQEYLISGKAP